MSALGVTFVFGGAQQVTWSSRKWQHSSHQRRERLKNHTGQQERVTELEKLLDSSLAVPHSSHLTTERSISPCAPPLSEYIFQREPRGGGKKYINKSHRDLLLFIKLSEWHSLFRQTNAAAPPSSAGERASPNRTNNKPFRKIDLLKNVDILLTVVLCSFIRVCITISAACSGFALGYKFFFYFPSALRLFLAPLPRPSRGPLRRFGSG